MNAQQPNPQLTQTYIEADLDRVLATANDSILPSSGFAESVMTAVHREALAPAPLAFPWKRALPGMIGAVAAAVLLIAAIVSFLRSAPAPGSAHPLAQIALSSSPTSSALTALFTNHATGRGTGTLWLAISLVISLSCLSLCRRLVSPR
jgi:hypothetical protein